MIHDGHSYGFSLDGRFYPVVNFPTHHAAQEAGRAYYGPEATFYTARCRKKLVEPSVDVRVVLADLVTKAESIGAKVGEEEFLDTVSPIQLDELQSGLDLLVSGWLVRHEFTKNLCGISVEDVRLHKAEKCDV